MWMRRSYNGGLYHSTCLNKKLSPIKTGDTVTIVIDPIKKVVGYIVNQGCLEIAFEGVGGEGVVPCVSSYREGVVVDVVEGWWEEGRSVRLWDDIQQAERGRGTKKKDGDDWVVTWVGEIVRRGDGRRCWDVIVVTCERLLIGLRLVGERAGEDEERKQYVFDGAVVDVTEGILRHGNGDIMGRFDGIERLRADDVISFVYEDDELSFEYNGRPLIHTALTISDDDVLWEPFVALRHDNDVVTIENGGMGRSSLELPLSEDCYKGLAYMGGKIAAWMVRGDDNDTTGVMSDNKEWLGGLSLVKDDDRDTTNIVVDDIASTKDNDPLYDYLETISPEPLTLIHRLQLTQSYNFPIVETPLRAVLCHHANIPPNVFDKEKDTPLPPLSPTTRSNLRLIQSTIQTIRRALRYEKQQLSTHEFIQLCDDLRQRTLVFSGVTFTSQNTTVVSVPATFTAITRYLIDGLLPSTSERRRRIRPPCPQTLQRQFEAQNNRALTRQKGLHAWCNLCRSITGSAREEVIAFITTSLTSTTKSDVSSCSPQMRHNISSSYHSLLSLLISWIPESITSHQIPLCCTLLFTIGSLPFPPHDLELLQKNRILVDFLEVLTSLDTTLHAARHCRSLIPPEKMTSCYNQDVRDLLSRGHLSRASLLKCLPLNDTNDPTKHSLSDLLLHHSTLYTTTPSLPPPTPPSQPLTYRITAPNGIGLRKRPSPHSERTGRTLTQHSLITAEWTFHHDGERQTYLRVYTGEDGGGWLFTRGVRGVFRGKEIMMCVDVVGVGEDGEGGVVWGRKGRHVVTTARDSVAIFAPERGRSHTGVGGVCLDRTWRCTTATDDGDADEKEQNYFEIICRGVNGRQSHITIGVIVRMDDSVEGGKMEMEEVILRHRLGTRAGSYGYHPQEDFVYIEGSIWNNDNDESRDTITNNDDTVRTNQTTSSVIDNTNSTRTQQSTTTATPTQQQNTHRYHPLHHDDVLGCGYNESNGLFMTKNGIIVRKHLPLPKGDAVTLVPVVTMGHREVVELVVSRDDLKWRGDDDCVDNNPCDVNDDLRIIEDSSSPYYIDWVTQRQQLPPPPPSTSSSILSSLSIHPLSTVSHLQRHSWNLFRVLLTQAVMQNNKSFIRKLLASLVSSLMAKPKSENDRREIVILERFYYERWHFLHVLLSTSGIVSECLVEQESQFLTFVMTIGIKDQATTQQKQNSPRVMRCIWGVLNRIMEARGIMNPLDGAAEAAISAMALEVDGKEVSFFMAWGLAIVGRLFQQPQLYHNDSDEDDKEQQRPYMGYGTTAFNDAIQISHILRKFLKSDESSVAVKNGWLHLLAALGSSHSSSSSDQSTTALWSRDDVRALSALFILSDIETFRIGAMVRRCYPETTTNDNDQHHQQHQYGVIVEPPKNHNNKTLNTNNHDDYGRHHNGVYIATNLPDDKHSNTHNDTPNIQFLSNPDEDYQPMISPKNHLPPPPNDTTANELITLLHSYISLKNCAIMRQWALMALAGLIRHDVIRRVLRHRCDVMTSLWEVGLMTSGTTLTLGEERRWEGEWRTLHSYLSEECISDIYKNDVDTQLSNGDTTATATLPPLPPPPLLYRVILPDGAVVRDGISIDNSERLKVLPKNTIVQVIERYYSRIDGIYRLRIKKWGDGGGEQQKGGDDGEGWISEMLRSTEDESGEGGRNVVIKVGYAMSDRVRLVHKNGSSSASSNPKIPTTTTGVTYRHRGHEHPLRCLPPSSLFPDSPGWKCDFCGADFDPMVKAYVSAKDNWVLCVKCFDSDPHVEIITGTTKKTTTEEDSVSSMDGNCYYGNDKMSLSQQQQESTTNTKRQDQQQVQNSIPKTTPSHPHPSSPTTNNNPTTIIRPTTHQRNNQTATLISQQTLYSPQLCQYALHICNDDYEKALSWLKHLDMTDKSGAFRCHVLSDKIAVYGSVCRVLGFVMKDETGVGLGSGTSSEKWEEMGKDGGDDKLTAMILSDGLMEEDDDDDDDECENQQTDDNTSNEPRRRQPRQNNNDDNLAWESSSHHSHTSHKTSLPPPTHHHPLLYLGDTLIIECTSDVHKLIGAIYCKDCHYLAFPPVGIQVPLSRMLSKMNANGRGSGSVVGDTRNVLGCDKYSTCQQCHSTQTELKQFAMTLPEGQFLLRSFPSRHRTNDLESCRFHLLQCHICQAVGFPGGVGPRWRRDGDGVSDSDCHFLRHLAIHDDESNCPFAFDDNNNNDTATSMSETYLHQWHQSLNHMNRCPHTGMDLRKIDVRTTFTDAKNLYHSYDGNNLSPASFRFQAGGLKRGMLIVYPIEEDSTVEAAQMTTSSSNVDDCRKTAGSYLMGVLREDQTSPIGDSLIVNVRNDDTGIVRAVSLPSANCRQVTGISGCRRQQRLRDEGQLSSSPLWNRLVTVAERRSIFQARRLLLGVLEGITKEITTTIDEVEENETDEQDVISSSMEIEQQLIDFGFYNRDHDDCRRRWSKLIDLIKLLIGPDVDTIARKGVPSRCGSTTRGWTMMIVNDNHVHDNEKPASSLSIHNLPSLSEAMLLLLRCWYHRPTIPVFRHLFNDLTRVSIMALNDITNGGSRQDTNGGDDDDVPPSSVFVMRESLHPQLPIACVIGETLDLSSFASGMNDERQELILSFDDRTQLCRGSSLTFWNTESSSNNGQKPLFTLRNDNNDDKTVNNNNNNDSNATTTTSTMRDIVVPKHSMSLFYKLEVMDNSRHCDNVYSKQKVLQMAPIGSNSMSVLRHGTDRLFGTTTIGDDGVISCTEGFPSLSPPSILLSRGKWYYEVTILQPGLAQIGWSDTRFTADSTNGNGVGDDAYSWGFDGHRVLKWHKGSSRWGKPWSEGDVVGCYADLDGRTLSFSINGDDGSPLGVAFSDVSFVGGLRPCVTFNRSCSFRVNFGNGDYHRGCDDGVVGISGGGAGHGLVHLPEGYAPVARALFESQELLPWGYRFSISKVDAIRTTAFRSFKKVGVCGNKTIWRGVEGVGGRRDVRSLGDVVTINGKRPKMTLGVIEAIGTTALALPMAFQRVNNTGDEHDYDDDYNVQEDNANHASLHLVATRNGPSFLRRDPRQEGSFWRPISPPGYVAMGVVYNPKSNNSPPSLDCIRCVRVNCMELIKRHIDNSDGWSCERDIMSRPSSSFAISMLSNFAVPSKTRQRHYSTSSLRGYTHSRMAGRMKDPEERHHHDNRDEQHERQSLFEMNWIDESCNSLAKMVLSPLCIRESRRLATASLVTFLQYLDDSHRIERKQHDNNDINKLVTPTHIMNAPRNCKSKYSLGNVSRLGMMLFEILNACRQKRESVGIFLPINLLQMVEIVALSFRVTAQQGRMLYENNSDNLNRRRCLSSPSPPLLCSESKQLMEVYTGIEYFLTSYENDEEGRKKDTALVQWINDRAEALQVSSLDVADSLFFESEETPYNTYPHLQWTDGVSRHVINDRLTRLLHFNKSLCACLYTIDLTNDTNESLGKQLRLCSHLILTTVKEPALAMAKKHTQGSGGSAVTVNLDNFLASQSIQSGQTSISNSQNTFVQAFRALKDKPPSILRTLWDGDRVFQVTFKGEGGSDAGGVFREGLSRIVEDLFEGTFNLFIRVVNGEEEVGLNRETFIPNPELFDGQRCGDNALLAIDMFEFVGKIMGVSLRTGLALPFQFPSVVWKSLAGHDLDISNLDEIDHLSYCWLREIEECQHDEWGVKFNTLTWTCIGSSGKTIKLPKCRIDKNVAFSDRFLFIDRVLTARFEELMLPLNAMRRGFLCVVPYRAIVLFSPNELMNLVCGDPDIDIDEWKKNTHYSGYVSDDETIIMFWNAVEKLTPKERSSLLRFAWGRSRLSKNTRRWPSRFHVSRRGGVDSLIQAHTCFAAIDLPPYTTMQQMEWALGIVIKYGTIGVLNT